MFAAPGLDTPNTAVSVPANYAIAPRVRRWDSARCHLGAKMPSTDNAKQSKSVTATGAQPIKTADLLLDPKNPRLAEYGISPTATPFDLLKTLWDEMAVAEVAMSIAYSGYFEHEPLFVEPDGKGKFVVIEGNRRLAAVMILLDPDYRKKLRATDLPQIDATAKQKLHTLPCVVTTRKEIWRYLGFKHVNGPATWGSYAKAQYIAHVHNEYGVPLEDIAAQIGDYNSTVQRMYRGLMIVEQAEKARVFSRNDVGKSKFYFNYIYTGMDYPGISGFLGLGTKGTTERSPVPSAKVKNLGELMGWLYGKESTNQPSLIRSQNPDLKMFDSVLQSEDGVNALRDGLSLSVASDISQGDPKIFRSSLQLAKQNLQKALGTLTTGYESDDAEALRLAEDIQELAQDLVDRMYQQKYRERRTARQSKRANG